MSARPSASWELYDGPPQEAIVLGPAPCHDCRHRLYWGYSFGWTPQWGTGRAAWREWATGSRHGCTLRKAA